MRTFTAKIGGNTLEIPTTMTVLRMAQEVSGVNLMDAIANDKHGSLLQGVLWAGLKLAGKEMGYDEVGDSCSFVETQENHINFIFALSADVPPVSPKNATEEKPTNP